MSEYTLQIIASSKIVWVAIFSLLYGLGGINNKWIRRFIGSAWMMAGIVLFSLIQGSWHNWYLLCYPLMVWGLSNGYGANQTLLKIRRRAIYGFILSISSIPLVAFSHNWPLFIWASCISVLSSVSFGSFNITGNARNEETLIATLSFLLMLFLI